ISAFFSHTAPMMKAMKTLYVNNLSPAEIRSVFFLSNAQGGTHVCQY
ncbi:anaerobic sulfatase maturase, partial [Salmonella enterica subsp. enterica serovar Paratyphi A]